MHQHDVRFFGEFRPHVPRPVAVSFFVAYGVLADTLAELEARSLRLRQLVAAP